jgi:hypothetical protein
VPLVGDRINQPLRPRAKRRRPAPAPSVPHNADTGDRARSRPAPPPRRPAPKPSTPAFRPTTQTQRSRPPAFRPIQSQAKPFKPQQTRAKRQTQQATKRLGDRRYNTPTVPAPPPFRIDPNRVARSPAFRPIGSQARPLRVQQSRAHQEARQARNKLPDHPAIPEVVDGLYLRTDLDKVEDAYKKARLRAARATSPAQLKAAQRQYRRQVAKIVNKTPEQRISAIRDAYKNAARDLGGTAISDLYQYGSLRQRRQMRRVGRTITDYEETLAQQIADERGIPVGQDVAKPAVEEVLGHPVKAGILGDVGKAFEAAGGALDRATRIPNKGNASIADVFNVMPQLALATAEDPAAVAKSSIRTGIESIASIPEGIKQMITDPKGAGAAMIKDYENRYGSIFDNPNEFRRHVKQDSGLTPFVLDAASLGVPIGRAATILARSGPAGRAVAALARVADENGKLRPLSDFATTAHKTARARRDATRLAGLRDSLSIAEREGDVPEQTRLKREIKHAQANVRSTERPALRFSGGPGGVRKQGSSANLIIGLGQRALDRSRRTAATRTAERAGLDEATGNRLVTVRGRKVTRMTALRPGEREVVPKTTGVVGRSGRELPGLRRYTGRVARDLGENQSVSRIKLLTHRGRVLNQIDKALKRLDENESSAMKYMLQLGASPDEAGVRLLRKRREQIVAARAGKQTKIAPLLEDSNDELALIDRILKNPADHLTPRARAVADELREIQIGEARRDPELDTEQELIRRMTPQGKALGVQRGPDVEFFRGVLRELEDETGLSGLAHTTDELAGIMPRPRGRDAPRRDQGPQAVRAQRPNR